jgi:ligand-binding sensor domain-containing protein
MQRSLAYFTTVLVLCGFIAGLSLAGPSLAQPAAAKLTGTWRSHACTSCVLSLAVTTDAVWVGTQSAGVLRQARGWGGTDQFTTVDGLGGNCIEHLAVAADGDVWVGTRASLLTSPATGVSHWDGQSWTAYRTSDGLPSDSAAALAPGPAGTVWVATAQGVGYFDGFTWRTYTTADGLPSNIVRSVAVGPDGSVWAGTDTGLAEFAGTWFLTVPTAELPSQDIVSLGADPDGTLWALAGGRLGHYSPGGWPGGRWWDLSTPPDTTNPTYLFLDPSGDVWLSGGVAQAHRFDGQAWTSVDIGTETGGLWTLTVTVSPEGELWIGTATRGVHARRAGVWSAVPFGTGPTNLIAFALAVDASDRPWVGFMPMLDGDNLVNHYDGAQWVRHDSREGVLRGGVLGVVQNAIDGDANGMVWVGVDGVGLARFDGAAWTTWTMTDVVGTSARVWHVKADDAGGVWLGTDVGALHFDGHSWRRFTTADGLASDKVHAIAVERSGPQDVVWFGTEAAGVSRWDGATWRTYTTADGLGADKVYDIVVDEQTDSVWFGAGSGTQGGITRYDGTAWQTFGAADGLAGDGVWALALAPDGAVWAALSEDGGDGPGVARFDGTTWSVYTTADGLIDDRVFDVAVDSRGTVWIATLAGVSEFTPDQGGYPYPAPTESSLPPSSIPPSPTPYGPATVMPSPTTWPPAIVTVMPTPTPGSTPVVASCVCTFIRGRVPDVVISDAVANPQRITGWMQLRDPNKHESPYNPRRTCLSIERISVPYNPVHNPVVWRAGCP